MSRIDLRKGNCLEVMKDIEDKSVDMILCDLPYNITSCEWDVLIPFEPLWEQYKRIIKDKGAIVLFGSQPFTSLLICSNIKNFKYEWVWEKQKASNFMSAKYQPLKYHENILVFSYGTHKYYPQKYNVLELSDIEDGYKQKGKKYLKELIDSNEIRKFGKVDRRKTVKDPTTNKELIGNKIKRTRSVDDGLRNPKSILTINKGVNTNIHPTQKPVDLLEYLIKTYTNEGELVLDNTMGSGSTGVAAINTNRDFIGIEMDDNYFEIAKERIDKALEIKDKALEIKEGKLG